nr:MAG TPA: hypothetical protein [Caudoviricetes sp.]
MREIKFKIWTGGHTLRSEDSQRLAYFYIENI